MAIESPIRVSNGAKRRRARRRARSGGLYLELLGKRKQIDSKARQLKININKLENRLTEEQISEAVLQYLMKSKSGTATIAELRDNLPNILDLSAADRETSESRPGEPRWVQQIRNLVSHRDVDGSIISEGLLIYDGSGSLSITDEGRFFAESKLTDVP